MYLESVVLFLRLVLILFMNWLFYFPFVLTKLDQGVIPVLTDTQKYWLQ